MKKAKCQQNNEIKTNFIKKARNSFKQSLKIKKSILLSLTEIIEALKNKPKANKRVASLDEINVLEKQLGNQFRCLKSTYKCLNKDMRASFLRLKEHLSEINVVLFGKTKSGKSTTMAALTESKSKGIGKEGQHTTRSVKVYDYPKEQPFLKILDTPGVEGFQGKKLAQMAAQHIDIADHILFILTEDKSSPTELKWLKKISLMGKPFSILVNYKTNLKTLIKRPNSIFNKADEYESDLKNRLTKEFGVNAAKIVHFHAHAAWLSLGIPEEHELEDLMQLLKCDNQKSLSIEQKDIFYKLSSIENIERLLRKIASKDAILSKIKAPVDIIRGYELAYRTSLKQTYSITKRNKTQLSNLKCKLEKAIEKTVVFGKDRLAVEKNLFLEIENEIPKLVDQTISAQKKTSDLISSVNRLLESKELNVIQRNFQDRVIEKLNKEIDWIVDLIKSSSKHYEAGKWGMEDGEVEKCFEWQTAKRFARAGGKAVGTLAGSALAAWALSNFWNPSGWVAAVGFGVATIAGGALGKGGADVIVEDFREEDEKKVREVKKDLTRKLKEHLWENIYERFNQDCFNWLKEELEKNGTRNVTDTIQPFINYCDIIEKKSKTSFQDICKSKHRLDKWLCTELTKLFFRGRTTPKVKKAIFGDNKVLSILLDPFPEINLRERKHLNRQLSLAKEVLGVESIRLIAQNWPTVDKIIYSLGLNKSDVKNIANEGGGKYVLTVTKSKTSKAKGYKGINVKNTQKLLKIREITISY